MAAGGEVRGPRGAGRGRASAGGRYTHGPALTHSDLDGCANTDGADLGDGTQADLTTQSQALQQASVWAEEKGSENEHLVQVRVRTNAAVARAVHRLTGYLKQGRARYISITNNPC